MKMAVQNIPTSAIFVKSTIWSPESSGTISISFSEEGVYSRIGSESSYNRPSMNLGWVDPPFSNSFEYFGSEISIEGDPGHRNYGYLDEYVPGATVIHEFGHALGMYHEHQSDLFGSNPIVLNNENVVTSYICQYCSGASTNEEYKICLDNPPIVNEECKTQATSDAEYNTIERYSCEEATRNGEPCPFAGSKFDKDSIMKYWFEPFWVSSGPAKSVPNFSLSVKDKEWLQAYYPKKDPSKFPKINIEFLDGPEWKKKWVIKMISENFGDILGIEWFFPEFNLLVKPSPEQQNKKNSIGALGAFPTKSLYNRVLDYNIPLNSEEFSNCKNKNNTWWIVIIILLVVVFILYNR